MRRAWLLCGGVLLGFAAVAVLWHGPDLYALTNSWHSIALTRMVGLGIIVEGALLALAAAWCLGRATVARTSARTQGGTADSGHTQAIGGGPVLPLCGILFLLAAAGPFGQARDNSRKLEVMDRMPANFGSDLVDELARQERTEWTFGALWLAVGGALLATPLLLKKRAWQLAWRMSRVGIGIAIGGFLLSGLGALVCCANALAMEGASQDVSFAGYLGMLAGSIIAVVGGAIAVAGRSTA